LQGTTLGAHADSFDVMFCANPNPKPGEDHRSAPCTEDCQQEIAERCHVNGTLEIENNSSFTITVNWKGSSGGTVIPPSQTGYFATGHELIACGENKTIGFTAGSDGMVANHQWTCNDCAAPPDAE
jgi:hypothetical protein